MKKVILTLVVLVIVAVGVFGYTIVFDMFNGKENDNTAENQNLRTDNNNNAEEENNNNADDKKEGKNPFDDDIEIDELTDDDFQDYIHEMSHQKVEADAKWGYYEITSDRTEWLLKGLDEASDLDHKQTYQDILEKWEDDDFSSVDEDHNAVWELQNGNMGEATGILSEEEEKEYMEDTEEGEAAGEEKEE